MVVAQRILAELRNPFLLQDWTCAIGGSIGIALAPRHGDDPDTLMRRADVAMYAAKRSGGGFAVFSAEQDEYNPSTEPDERPSRGDRGQRARALLSAEMESQKPPARSRRSTGTWPHPQHGMIPPSRFIPMAEHVGLMGQLDDGRQSGDRSAPSNGGIAGSISGSPSTSLRAFSIMSHSIESIVDRFRRTSLPLSWLTLEITESTLMQNPNRRHRGSEAVTERPWPQDLGRRLRDRLLIARLSPTTPGGRDQDRSRVRQGYDYVVEDAAIVKTVINLGHNLGLRVVAEGVEDQETLELLASLRCDQAQGYFISRPLPADDLASGRCPSASSSCLN